MKQTQQAIAIITQSLKENIIFFQIFSSRLHRLLIIYTLYIKKSIGFINFIHIFLNYEFLYIFIKSQTFKFDSYINYYFLFYFKIFYNYSAIVTVFSNFICAIRIYFVLIFIIKSKYYCFCIIIIFYCMSFLYY